MRNAAWNQNNYYDETKFLGHIIIANWLRTDTFLLDLVDKVNAKFALKFEYVSEF